MGLARVSKSFSTSPEIWESVEGEASRQGVSISHVINEALGLRMRTKIERDGWDTVDASESYDPLRFYTASEDRKGHSAYAKFAVPKNVMGQVKRIIDSGLIPEYRGLSDFFRDATMHRAKFIATALDDGLLSAEIDLHLMIAEQAAIRQQKSDVEVLLTNIRTNMEDAFTRQDYQWVRENLEDLARRTESIPHRYRQMFLNVLAEFLDRVNREAPVKDQIAERRTKRQRA